MRSKTVRVPVSSGSAPTQPENEVRKLSDNVQVIFGSEVGVVHLDTVEDSVIVTMEIDLFKDTINEKVECFD